MTKNARRWLKPVGFLDPHLFSEQCITENASYIVKYITTGLLAQGDNHYILVPYNQK